MYFLTSSSLTFWMEIVRLPLMTLEDTRSRCANLLAHPHANRQQHAYNIELYLVKIVHYQCFNIDVSLQNLV